MPVSAHLLGVGTCQEEVGHWGGLVRPVGILPGCFPVQRLGDLHDGGPRDFETPGRWEKVHHLGME